jgi:hypothetical protein
MQVLVRVRFMSMFKVQVAEDLSGLIPKPGIHPFLNLIG